MQHKAQYNNFIKELLDALEGPVQDMGIYARLLAMECELKEWTEEQMQQTESNAFITDQMLSFCEDTCTNVALEMKTELQSLLVYLDDYWQTTSEVKSGLN